MLKRWIELHTEKTSWLLDIEFLMSSYECNWGNGCKGINPQKPHLGCCANGAYLEESDIKLLEERVKTLTPETWQRHGTNYLQKVRDSGKFPLPIFSKAEYKTAVADKNDTVSGCVFSNDPDFAGGAGCALHIAATNAEENPMDWKPTICWQMPLFVDFVTELNTHIVRAFYWSEEDYPWFCMNDEINWVAKKPLYQTMAGELERSIKHYGDEEAYPKIKELLDSIWVQVGKKTLKKRIPVTLVAQ